MKQEERFWLRSPGAVPPDLNYLEPGEGNLRGYAAQDDWRISQTVAGTRVDATLDYQTASWGSRAAVES